MLKFVCIPRPPRIETTTKGLETTPLPDNPFTGCEYKVFDSVECIPGKANWHIIIGMLIYFIPDMKKRFYNVLLQSLVVSLEI